MDNAAKLDAALSFADAIDKKIGRHGYNPESVNEAIAASNRHGQKIGGKEAKMIHALLRGRDAPKKEDEKKDSDAGGQGNPGRKRMFPGYTLTELKKNVQAATGDTKAKMEAEIKARETPGDKPFVVPQIKRGDAEGKVKFAVRLYEKAEHWTLDTTIEASSEEAARKIITKMYPPREYSIRDIRRDN